MKARRFSIAAAVALLAGANQAADTSAPVPPPADRALAHDILKELVEIDSTHAHGSTEAAEAVAGRLRRAGFPAEDIHVLAPADHPTKGNTVVRLRGKGLAKPVLFIGHLDVVEARPEDWSFNPFELVEKDGFFYGRGTADMKGDDAAMLESLIRLRSEGFVPDRDIIVAFTADEEAGGDANGIEWLLKTHPALVDAAVVFNPDSGGGGLSAGERLDYGVQTSEKLYVTYAMEAQSRGGHSSMPGPDNAIYELCQALLRLSAHRFPVHLTDATRSHFAKSAPSQSADAEDDALLRTTCVATMMTAGHAESALPERARAAVQCRLIPGETPEEVQKILADVVADPCVQISIIRQGDPSPETVPDPEIMARLGRVVRGMWPGVPVMPVMDAAASDSAHTRNAGIPSYGVSSIFIDIDDMRAHGRDERIGITSFYEGVEFTYRLMKVMSGGPG